MLETKQWAFCILAIQTNYIYFKEWLETTIFQKAFLIKYFIEKHVIQVNIHT